MHSAMLHVLFMVEYLVISVVSLSAFHQFFSQSLLLFLLVVRATGILLCLVLFHFRWWSIHFHLILLQSKYLCVYVAHKAISNTLFQFPQSLAVNSVDFQLSLSLSASTVLLHIVSGCSLFHLPSGVQVSEILVLSDVSLRSII